MHTHTYASEYVCLRRSCVHVHVFEYTLGNFCTHQVSLAFHPEQTTVHIITGFNSLVHFIVGLNALNHVFFGWLFDVVLAVRQHWKKVDRFLEKESNTLHSKNVLHMEKISTGNTRENPIFISPFSCLTISWENPNTICLSIHFESFGAHWQSVVKSV